MHTPHPGSVESHGAPALPFWVHGPRMPMGHAMLGQAAAPVQDTSQLHDAAQSIIGHASAPEHWMVHSCMPQLRLPHEAEPEHSTLQLCACAQSTAPHAPPLLHRILQS